jgi:peptidoglycan biosynthesis protein MviN/MurJ (putative lipid II flippase)
MDKKSLVSKQVVIVLYIMAAAISFIEATVQYKIGGFSNWKLYLVLLVFLASVSMYFIKKKQRFQEKK